MFSGLGKPRTPNRYQMRVENSFGGNLKKIKPHIACLSEPKKYTQGNHMKAAFEDIFIIVMYNMTQINNFFLEEPKPKFDIN